MRIVVQRVTSASVRVDGVVTGSIQRGLLVLMGVAKGDAQSDADFLAEKCLTLRIFPDDDGKMNRNVSEAGGSVLAVSQFTLYGDVRKGRRPSFDRAADPELARNLYEYFLSALRLRGATVQSGVFQAMMQVELINDGPVTILCDSERTI